MRVKLLKLFFTDLETELHIRGIVRKIDEEINAVRRELKNLEEATILNSERRGNRLYYKINRSCPFFYDILGIVNKEFGLGGKVLENRDRLGDVKYAVLTMAYIEDHHPSQFDVDLLIVGEINMKTVSSLIKSAEEDTKREIRYTVMNDDELEFRKKKRDSFVENILKQHKIMLIGDENRLMASLT